MTTQTAETTAITTHQAAPELPVSVRFTNSVVERFRNGVGDVALTKFQLRLAQNYFIAVEEAISKFELRRDPQKEQTPASWKTINMDRLAQDVVACARIGLDPLENNHISPVLYKNKRSGLYDVGMMPRYKGLQIKAQKYGLNPPDDIIIELVFSTDRFKSIKKDLKNKVESYEFEITNEFDRGDIIGGFYYFVYHAKPEQNKLVVMSKKDIDKRKPKYASNEFWGTWYERMAYKTICRAAYASIPIDSQKIDDDYHRLSRMESDSSEVEFNELIEQDANSTPLLLEDQPPLQQAEENNGEVIDQDTGEIIPPQPQQDIKPTSAAPFAR